MEKSSVPYDTLSVNSVSKDTMFSKCCFCIPLRIGCFILGYMNLFFTSLRTIVLIGLTFYLGLKTHGFYYFDIPVEDQVERTYTKGMDSESVHYLGWVLVFMTIFELFWLSINIVCLVGIHKKQPGHIRTYIGFATIRLIISVVAYLYQVNMVHGGIVSRFLDVALSAYFIFVYYIYAVRLEREARGVPSVEAPEIPQTISHIYPTKLDKEHLVVKY